MVWTAAANHRISGVGGRFEMGYVTLGATGTVEIPTEFSAILGIQAVYCTLPVFPGTLYSDGTLTSGGVTLTSTEGANASGGVVWYQLEGY